MSQKKTRLSRGTCGSHCRALGLRAINTDTYSGYVIYLFMEKMRYKCL